MVARASDTYTTSSERVMLGDELSRDGHYTDAISAYLSATELVEVVPADLCLKLARNYLHEGSFSEVFRWALSVVDAGDDYLSWHAAASLIQRCPADQVPASRRTARVSVLGSYTTLQLVKLLGLASRRIGLELILHEGLFGQYQQDILDPHSSFYASSPEFLVLAVHEGEVKLPSLSQTPDADVEAELMRWTALWKTVFSRCSASIVQHNFAIPYELPMGHLGAKLPGSRYMMTQRLNLRLGESASGRLLMVDCDRLSASFGKSKWFNPRYWQISKQAVALEALPLLARHTSSVLAGGVGLTRKCLVLDLDNTLWGGVIAEDGLAGIKLGNDPEGEAFLSLQEYILQLKNKGVILAVCSKNNEADAKDPFLNHPEMRIRLKDIAIFVANWQSKPENLRRIARTLGIGLDSMVFLDDSQFERSAVREMIPEVDVIDLPADPSGYTRTLSEYLLFEASSLTQEDKERTTQYQARAQIAEAQTSAESLDDFYRLLQMKALVAPFDDLHLGRIGQLVGKTNQFNLTTRRHSLAQLKSFMEDPDCIHFYLRLRDRFTDHGLVALIIAFRRGDTLDIDTWLMSCRVIGRSVEATMLEQLCRRALRLGCSQLRGTYIPSAKNMMARDIFEKFGFERTTESGDDEKWLYSLNTRGPIKNSFIESIESWEFE
jgi:FkbH-like protein